MTWERLKELMDSQYYPRDVHRIKEREFLSLKQRNLRIMEYSAKFNELSRFAPHEVNTEERKMDHLEQGFKGSIRSMIVGQTFENFQDMYRGAVKISHVLEESESENRALNLGKRKMELHKRGFRGRNYKQYKPSYPQGKGKRPRAWRNRPFCRSCGRHHDRPCTLENMRCYGCGEMGHKMNNCLKTAWNQSKMPSTAYQPRPQTSAPRGRPPAPGASQQTRNFKKPQAGGQVYCIETGEEKVKTCMQ